MVEKRFLSPVDGKGSRFLSPVDGKGSRFPVWRREISLRERFQVPRTSERRFLSPVDGKVPGSLHGGRRFLSPVDGKRFQVPQSSRRERFQVPCMAERRCLAGKVPGSPYVGEKVPQSSRRGGSRFPAR